jgi:hypothetical protein
MNEIVLWTFVAVLQALILGLLVAALRAVKPRDPEPGDDEFPVTAQNVGVYFLNAATGAMHYAVFNPVSGYWMEYTGGGTAKMPNEYHNMLAQAYQTKAWAQVTPAHADHLREACARVRENHRWTGTTLRKAKP